MALTAILRMQSQTLLVHVGHAPMVARELARDEVVLLHFMGRETRYEPACRPWHAGVQVSRSRAMSDLELAYWAREDARRERAEEAAAKVRNAEMTAKLAAYRARKGQV